MTELELVNKALLLIGVEPVTSLNQGTKSAVVMNTLMTGCRRSVLNEFPWPFAVSIIAVSETAGSISGFTKLYKYPANAVNVRAVWNGAELANYKILKLVNTKVIGVIGTAEAVEYTENVTDLSIWNTQVLDCLAHRLASDAAMSLTGSPQLSANMFEKYRYLLMQAKSTVVLEENIVPSAADDYTRVRR